MGNILNTKNIYNYTDEHIRCQIVDCKNNTLNKKEQPSIHFSVDENTKVNNKYYFTNSKILSSMFSFSPVFFIKKY